MPRAAGAAGSSGPAGGARRPRRRARRSDRRRRAARRARRARPARPTSPSCAMSAPSADKRAAEEIANRKQCEDFETVQAAVRAGAEATSRRRPAPDAAASRRSSRRSRPGDFFILGGQIAYVAGVGEDVQDDARRSRPPPARHLRQRHREQLLLRSLQRALLQGRRRPAASPSPRPGRCFGGEAEDGRPGKRHDLRPAQQVGSSRSSRRTATDPQDRRDRRRGRGRIANAEHRPHLSAGGRRNRRDLQAVQHQPHAGWRTCFTASSRRRGSTSTIKDRFGNPVQPTRVVPRAAVRHR